MTQPFPYQRKGVRKIHHFDGRALLADEMGLGKSLQSLLYMEESQSYPAVIVCEAGLKFNWEREAKIHCNIRATVLEGRQPSVKALRRTKLIIINYDILGDWLPLLRKLRPQLIILDECQMIKNRAAKRTKHVKKLCKIAQRVLGLSGTPLTNRPAELWPILNILRPDLFNSFFSFGARYCQPQRRRWGWEYKGAVRLKELNTLLNTTCMIRRLKVDVLEQLPKQSRYVVPLEISNRKEYDKAVSDFLGWLLKKHVGKAEKAAKAERLVKIGYISA